MSHQPLNKKLLVYAMAFFYVMGIMMLISEVNFWIALVFCLSGIPLIWMALTPTIYFNENEIVIHRALSKETVRMIDVMYLKDVSLMPLTPFYHYKLEYLKDRERVSVNFYHKEMKFLWEDKKDDAIHDFVQLASEKNRHFEYYV